MLNMLKLNLLYIMWYDILNKIFKSYKIKLMKSCFISYFKNR